MRFSINEYFFVPASANLCYTCFQAVPGTNEKTGEPKAPRRLFYTPTLQRGITLLCNDPRSTLSNADKEQATAVANTLVDIEAKLVAFSRDDLPLETNGAYIIDGKRDFPTELANSSRTRYTPDLAYAALIIYRDLLMGADIDTNLENITQFAESVREAMYANVQPNTVKTKAATENAPEEDEEE